MNAPSQFSQLLHQAFDGRLRIRWSSRLNEWHIEQRVGRPLFPPHHISEGDDDGIRARDGYHYVMSVRTGDRMPCPECGLQLSVPVMDTWDIKCGYCASKGRTRSVIAGFWPLNDRLIAHLQKIDPNRDVDIAGETDAANRCLLQRQEDDAMRPGEAYVNDRYNRLVGIEQTGWTGKEFRG